MRHAGPLDTGAGAAAAAAGRAAGPASGQGPGPPLVLTRGQVARLLTLEACMAGVEQALVQAARGETAPPATLEAQAPAGAFHVKAALLAAGRPVWVFKANANFPDNPARWGLPAIQGMIGLFDAERGIPLALMDSIEITILRTGATTAVAARRLAREDARVLTVCGCGQQGRVHLRALARVRPLERAYLFDADPGRARALAAELGGELALELVPVTDLVRAVRDSQICVTCTPSRGPLLGPPRWPCSTWPCCPSSCRPGRRRSPARCSWRACTS
jgi:alanine dehydrogenase